MTNKALINESSLNFSGSEGLSNPERPPIRNNGLEPESAQISNTHTSAAGPMSPSSDQTPDPAAPSETCYCNVVVATRAAYIDMDGEEQDMQVYYRRCPVHEQGGHGDFLDTLYDFRRDPHLDLTKEGRAFMNKLRRESDKKNPHIPELERVKREIEEADEFLSWCEHAQEKREEWNQQYSVSLAMTGTGIPYPDWLRRFSRENQKAMEIRRDELFNQKLEIREKIVDWRYQISNPQGGNP